MRQPSRASSSVTLFVVFVVVVGIAVVVSSFKESTKVSCPQPLQLPPLPSKCPPAPVCECPEKKCEPCAECPKQETVKCPDPVPPPPPTQQQCAGNAVLDIQGKPKAVIIYLLGPKARVYEPASKRYPNLTRIELLTRSLQRLDKYYNDKYHYPCIIFHEDLDIFDMRRLQSQTHTALQFERTDFTNPPCGITREQIKRYIRGEDGGLPGNNPGYRFMCRFWSGVVQNHISLAPYDYYLRLDDDSMFTSEVPFDLFQHMVDNDIKYAWRCVFSYTDKQSVADAFRTFARTHNLSLDEMVKAGVADKNAWPTGRIYYNNFHASALDYWRTPIFQELFALFEEMRGHWKWRWGDAEIQTMISALFLRADQLHEYREFGYNHNYHSASVNSGHCAYIVDDKWMDPVS